MAGDPGESREAVFRPSADVVFSKLGDTGVLVHLRSNKIFELNATGVRVWTLLADGQPASAIVSLLREEFDASPDELQRDVQSLLTELASEGLVDVASTG